MSALSNAKAYLAKQAASGIQRTMHADHIEVILARLVAEIDAAPTGHSLGAVIYHDDERFATDCEGKRVRLLALDSDGAGEVGSG